MDDETVDRIAVQAEQSARMHPGWHWAYQMQRCVDAIRYLQAELETARLLA